MSLSGKHETVAIKDIRLDVENPRIKRFLEMYGDNPTPEQIALALGAGIDDAEGQSGPTFSKLKQSILTHGGVIQPVLINRNAAGECLLAQFRQSWIQFALIGCNLLHLNAICFICKQI